MGLTMSAENAFTPWKFPIGEEEICTHHTEQIMHLEKHKVSKNENVLAFTSL